MLIVWACDVRSLLTGGGTRKTHPLYVKQNGFGKYFHPAAASAVAAAAAVVGGRTRKECDSFDRGRVSVCGTVCPLNACLRPRALMSPGFIGIYLGCLLL